MENEVFAVIRRMDTDGDARISYNEFADFFKTEWKGESPVRTPNKSYYKQDSG